MHRDRTLLLQVLEQTLRQKHDRTALEGLNLFDAKPGQADSLVVGHRDLLK